MPMPSGRHRIPDRWEEYNAIGNKISGTRFVAFKVPLQENLCRSLRTRDRFSLSDLFEQLGQNGLKLGLVIDLTNTTRYYNAMQMEEFGVKHIKIFTEGHVVPNKTVRTKFKSYVDDFLERNANNDLLIGVHCTHGVNRTGYLICRYMIDNLSIDPEQAIEAFKEARGYPIERDNYLTDLRSQPTDSDLDTLDISDRVPEDTRGERHRGASKHGRFEEDVFLPAAMETTPHSYSSSRSSAFGSSSSRYHYSEPARRFEERRSGRPFNSSASNSQQQREQGGGRMQHSHSWCGNAFYGKPYAPGWPSSSSSSLYHQKSPHYQSVNGHGGQRSWDNSNNIRHARSWPVDLSYSGNDNNSSRAGYSGNGGHAGSGSSHSNWRQSRTYDGRGGPLQRSADNCYAAPAAPSYWNNWSERDEEELHEEEVEGNDGGGVEEEWGYAGISE